MVAYPIFDLRGFPSDGASRKTLGAIEYVRRLEEVLIRSCADFGIAAKRILGLTGVWTEASAPATSKEHVGTGALAGPVESQNRQPSSGAESKIAALGVHISRGVTSHGVALNVNTDLSFFNLIVPCGISLKPVTSMQKELNRQLPMQEVAHSLSRNVGTVFGSQILWPDNLDALLGTNLGVPMKAPKNLRRIHGEDDPAWA